MKNPDYSQQKIKVLNWGKEWEIQDKNNWAYQRGINEKCNEDLKKQIEFLGSIATNGSMKRIMHFSLQFVWKRKEIRSTPVFWTVFTLLFE